MAAAIRRFGFTMPLMVDEDDLLIAEHRRLEAPHVIGLKNVPAIDGSYMTPEERRA